jgi:SAM-dependent methyltransferase
MDLPRNVNGGAFYDQPGVAEQFREHRESGARSPNLVMEEPAVLAELGSLAGLRVLDLGCGDGSFGRTATAAGCRSYLGIDASQAMVAEARSRLTGTGARVEHSDLAQLEGQAGAFDVIVSRMVLHYLDDVGPVLAAARRSLAPGGRLVITVAHPVLTAPKLVEATGERTSWLVDDYFEPGARERPWFGRTVTWFHRTVEEYVREVMTAGIRLTSLQECAPVEARFEGDEPELRRRRRVPLFLLLAGDIPG